MRVGGGVRVGDHIKKPEGSSVSVCFANTRNPLPSSFSLALSLSNSRPYAFHLEQSHTKTDTYRKEIILGILLKTRFVG